MAKHSTENIDRLLAALKAAIEAAEHSPRYFRTLIPVEEDAVPIPVPMPLRARAVGE
jgi:hypothetical protein